MFVCDVLLTIARYDIEKKLRDHFPLLALQGEICGPKIQRNLLGLKENTFYVFGVFDLNTKRVLCYDEMLVVCKKLGIPVVQFVERGQSFAYSIKDVLKR